MAFNLRLNVQNVFRRLGIQTGRLPQLNENIQMTMQLTDLSRLIPAPIEPRGLAAFNQPGSGVAVPTVQLQARASGGIFVERVSLRPLGFVQTEGYWVNIAPPNATFGGDLGLPIAENVIFGLPHPANINIGGTPIASVFTAGPAGFSSFGTIISAEAGDSLFQYDLGAFVPNQSFFTVQPTNQLRRLDITIVYRELPSVEQV